MISGRYIARPLSIYLNDLSGKKIAPGGGSASALTASLGAALNLMVLNFTIEKNENNDKLIVLRTRQNKSVKRLAVLIDKDCDVFSALMMAISRKDQDIDDKYKKAALVPMEIADECLLSLKVAMYLAKKGNKNLVSDVGCAAHFLRGAFYSARLNVLINLKYIKDKKFVKSLNKQLTADKKVIDGLCLRIGKIIEV